MPRHDPPPGPRPLPAAQRLIVRYAKRGRLRFASHRDIARAVERGVRKAGLPIALSGGFTPHPKISYAGAAPTGTASEAEYLELSLTEAYAASEVRDRLDAALPDGIDVIDVMDGSTPLADLRLEASEWEVVLPGVQPQQAARAVTEFLALESAGVERLTSKGKRHVDARAAVVTMEADRRTAAMQEGTAAMQEGTAATQEGTAASQSDGNAIVRMVVRHVIPAVRPDDILAALHRETALAPTSPPKVTRLVQGPIDEVTARSPAGAHRPTGPDRPGAVAQPGGQGAAPEQMDTTRPAAEATGVAELPASAYDQFPRGAEQRAAAFAPGSLTGDCPDARERAEQRVQR